MMKAKQIQTEQCQCKVKNNTMIRIRRNTKLNRRTIDLEDSRLEMDTNVLAKIIASAEGFIAAVEGARMCCRKGKLCQQTANNYERTNKNSKTCVCHKCECCERVVLNARLGRSTFRNQQRRKRRFGFRQDRCQQLEWEFQTLYDANDQEFSCRNQR